MPSIAPAPHPLVASQLPSWYPQNESYALKSVVIPLPRGFLDYLQEDGVFLPDDTTAVHQLDYIDTALLADGDYRRDDWDTLAVAAPAPARAGPGEAVAGRQPSPSGPLHVGRGDILSGSAQTSAAAVTDNGGDGGGSDSDSGSEAAGGGHSLDWTVRFPQLRAAVDAAVASLGGRVVPKLNWSAPSDALWISATSSLACRNAEQVVLLLKSSDRVAHDVALLAGAAAAWANAAASIKCGRGADGGSGEGGAPGASAAESGISRSSAPQGPAPAPANTGGMSTGGCGVGSAAVAAAGSGPAGNADGAGEATSPDRFSAAALSEGAGAGSAQGGGPGSAHATGAACPLQPVLVLKKWHNLRPEREFRCFVRGGRLVAASQRDVSQAFPALTAEAVDDVRGRLWRFWAERMRAGAGGAVPLQTYAFDVYVPSDSPGWHSVRLMDVNPITDTTSPLLFEWAELGLGPAAVPAAEDLLRTLFVVGEEEAPAPPAPTTGGEQQQQQQGGAGRDDGVDESWMEESGLAALPLPESAEQLQVRIVESGAAGRPAAAGAGEGGDSGMAGLLGPMLLGSRAALAMPYDMLGIADSVDKMVEVMARRQQTQRQGQQQGQQGAGSDSDDEGGSSASGRTSGSEGGEEDASMGGAAVPPAGGAGRGAAGLGAGLESDGPSAQELAAVFGGGAVGLGVAGADEAEVQGTVADMMALMGDGEGPAAAGGGLEDL